jgi:hypothetical protein
MNYKKHYDLLINSRKDRLLEKNMYYEKHHIVPKSMGGTNKKENTFFLTAKEHFIAHLLLWKIHNNKQMAFAYYALAYMGRGYKIKSSKTYEDCKLARRSYIVENNKKFHTGKKLSKKLKSDISKRFKNMIRTKEHCNNISKSLKGKPKTETHKKKLSKSLKKFDWSSHFERNLKISKANSGKNNPRAKEVYMFDKDKKLIKAFNTMKDALEYVSKKNTISKTTFYRRIVKNKMVNNFYFSFELRVK